MARKFQPQMATGNDLLVGDVVYFTSEGEWSREIGDAALAVNPEAAKDLLERASAFPNGSASSIAQLIWTLLMRTPSSRSVATDSAASSNSTA